jgi:hypothetical protein
MKKQITLLSLIILMAACGGNNNKNAESTEDSKKDKIELKSDDGSVTIDGDKGKMAIEAEDGSKVEVNIGGRQSVPDGFPEDIVPIYKNSKIIATSKNFVEGKESFLVSLGSDDSVDEIANFYKGKFSKKEIVSDMNMNGVKMLAVKKGDYNVAIHILASDVDEYPTAASITLTAN